jgi:hypothetical protein
MNPADYFNEFVEPTIQEFKDDPENIRRAYLACVVTFHFADCVKEASSMELVAIRKDLEGRSGTFDLIGALANLSKHFQLDPRQHRMPISQTDIHVGPAAPFTDGTYFTDGTAWTDSPAVVRVRAGGKLKDVLHCLQQARHAIIMFLKESSGL